MLRFFRYGCRQWHSKIQQYILLTLGFSLVLTSLTLCLAIARYILQDRPDWFQSAPTLVTLGKQGIDGRFVGVSVLDQQQFSQLPAIKKHSRIGLTQSTLQFEQQDKKLAVNIGLFDEALRPWLSAEVSRQLQSATDRSLWLSPDFYQQHQHNLTEGETLYLGVEKKPFVFRGVLPASMQRIGLSNIDLWLPDQFAHELLQLTLTFSGTLDTQTQQSMYKQIKDNLLKSRDSYYVIAELQHKTQFPQLQQALAALPPVKAQGLNLKQNSKGLSYQLASGVQFQPALTKSLQQQWWILMAFVGFLALLCTLNLFAFASSQLAKRRQEMMTRLACGASTRSLCQQFLEESLPLIMGISLLTAVSLLACYDALAEHELVLKFLGAPLPTPGITLILLAWLLVLLLVVAGNLLPLLHLLKNNLFDRQTGQTENPQEKRWRYWIMVFQLLVAAHTACAAGYFLQQQWLKQQISGLDPTLSEYLLTTNNGQIFNQTLLSSLQQQLQQDAGLAHSQFISPTAGRELVYQRGAGAQSGHWVLQLFVTPQYLQLLAAANPLSYQDKLNEQSVLLNRAAAKLLLPEPGQNSGQISVGEMSPKHYQVAGVIDNLPHYGSQHSDTPVIYTLMKNPLTHQISVLSIDPTLVQRITDPDLHIESRGPVITQVRQFDYQQQSFYQLSIGLLLTLLLLNFSTLFYQLTQLMLRQQASLATMLALGAPDGRLFCYLLQQFYRPIIYSSVVLSLSLIFSLSQKLLEAPQAAVFFCAAMLIVIAVVFAMLFLQFRRLQQASVASLLPGAV